MEWKFVKEGRGRHWVFYTLLALLIMAPLLRSGFVLTFDMVFTPKIAAPTTVTNDYLFYQLIHGLNQYIPADVIQKFIMFAILLFSGAGMHRLIDKKQQPKKIRKLKNSRLDIVRIYGKTKVLNSLKATAAVPAYFAGILYVVNRFTYERWMAGHYLLLAGYAVLPWLLYSLFAYVNRPSWKSALKLALFYTLIGVLSIHMLVIALLAGVVAGIVYTINAPQKFSYLSELLQSGAFMFLLFAVINSFWLSPIVRGNAPINDKLGKITLQHLEAFTTAPHHSVGLLPNVIGMHGFWLEKYHRFVIPNANYFLSLPVLLILLALVVFGVRYRLKQDRPQTVTILILGVVGLFIAAGIHAPWGAINEWLLLHVPLLKGFREPEKFSALLVLLYAYFGAYGLQVFADKATAMKESILTYLPTALLILPIALVPVMPLGFGGQLKATNYPASWYTFEQKLAREGGDFKVLFLPWHEYMSYDFNLRIIANPAPSFFGSRIISGDNAEFGEVFSDSTNLTSAYVEKEILGKTGQPGIGKRLASEKIKYIALAHGPDWGQYIFLANQPQLKLVSQDNSLIVYLNLEYK